MEEYKPKRKYKLDVPEDFPKLSKQISNLDDFISRLPYAKNLGTQATVLNNLKKRPIMVFFVLLFILFKKSFELS